MIENLGIFGIAYYESVDAVAGELRVGQAHPLRHHKVYLIAVIFYLISL